MNGFEDIKSFPFLILNSANSRTPPQKPVLSNKLRAEQTVNVQESSLHFTSRNTELSVLHSEKLRVDPDNFKLLADCLTIVLAAQMGTDFSGEVQAALKKFLAVVVSSLGRQYH
nr:PREDICTED: hemoglobin subunit beta-like [Paralichthys olivaceus]